METGTASKREVEEYIIHPKYFKKLSIGDYVHINKNNATVMVTELINLHQAAEILGSMASVYFVSVAGIVAAFFGAQAWSGKK